MNASKKLEDIPAIDLSGVDKTNGTMEDAIQRLNEGDVYADIAIRDLNTKDSSEVAYKFSEYFADFASTNTNEHVSAVLMGFLSKFLAMPRTRNIDLEIDHSEPEKTILTIGRAIADDLLIEFNEIKNADDVERLAANYSQSLNEYAQKMSDEGNPLLLQGFLGKMLLACTEPLETLDETGDAQSKMTLMDAGRKGRKLGDEMLLELEGAADDEDAECIMLNFTEKLAIFAQNNSQTNSHSVLFNFLTNAFVSKNEVKKAA